MVKRKIQTHKWWQCEICFECYDTKARAIECEKQPAKKITTPNCKNWKIKDLVIVKVCEENIYHLARITALRNEYHKSIPIFELLDNDDTVEYSDFKFDDFVVITDKIRLKLKRWLDEIR